MITPNDTNRGNHAEPGRLMQRAEKLAGAAGFEPAHGGTKNRCLTAWLRPKSQAACIASAPAPRKQRLRRAKPRAQLKSAPPAVIHRQEEKPFTHRVAEPDCR